MVAIVIISGIIALVLFRYQHRVKAGYDYAGRRTAPIRTWMLPVPQLYRDILKRDFQYYQHLTQSEKGRFERKVCNFLYSKRFVPRNMEMIPIEARVLIAASAVQLTFGLPNFYLRHFNKILVYPNEYYSSITRQYHKGEVNPRFGIIVLSLNHFMKGYLEPEGCNNLGLHEMAHALRLENIIRSEEYKFFDEHLVTALDAYARRVCADPKEFGNFFRPYACTNEHEFFSVAVEDFFCRGEKFKQQIPGLYAILVKLLGQDPLKRKQA